MKYLDNVYSEILVMMVKLTHCWKSHLMTKTPLG